MKTAIGTKVIGFEVMSEKTFRELKGQGWGGHEDVDGYHVQYSGVNGKPDYDSWSPKNVFEDAYRDIEQGMTFGDAVFFLKQGKKVARFGWNGKGMWIWLCEVDAEATWTSSEGETYGRLPYLYMKTADNKVVPWLASQTDVLAEDWILV